MRIFADYHTHTVYSHGKGSIEDNVKAAIEKGLREIAISDHGPGHMGFGIKRSRYSEMREVIDRLQTKYPEIQIKLGLEANVLNMDGKIDVDEDMVRTQDILLAGYHFGSRPIRIFRDLSNHLLNYLSRHNAWAYSKVKDMNTQALINAMKNYNIDVITHPGAKGPVDMLEVAKVAAQTGTALEINSHHGHLTLEEIKIAMTVEELKFVISSDAHHPSDVANVTKGLKRAQEAGLSRFN